MQVRISTTILKLNFCVIAHYNRIINIKRQNFTNKRRLQSFTGVLGMRNYEYAFVHVCMQGAYKYPNLCIPALHDHT